VAEMGGTYSTREILPKNSIIERRFSLAVTIHIFPSYFEMLFSIILCLPGSWEQGFKIKTLGAFLMSFMRFMSCRYHNFYLVILMLAYLVKSVNYGVRHYAVFYSSLSRNTRN
jgi:hypothetical protein